jgi:hypothetical protein
MAGQEVHRIVVYSFIIATESFRLRAHRVAALPEASP